MTYGLRLRFFIHGPRLKSDALSEDFQLVDGCQVRLAATWPDVKLCDTRDLKLTGSGFETQGDAEACGRRLRNALVASMAELKLGIDTGKDRGTLQVSEAMRESFAKPAAPVAMLGRGELLHPSRRKKESASKTRSR